MKDGGGDDRAFCSLLLSFLHVKSMQTFPFRLHLRSLGLFKPCSAFGTSLITCISRSSRSSMTLNVTTPAMGLACKIKEKSGTSPLWICCVTCNSSVNPQ